MAIPLRNTVFERIKDAGSLTDVELSKLLIKEGTVIAEDRFNKLLLDLEIMGLVKIAWLTKDTRRIEVVTKSEDVDEVEEQAKQMQERDYESSFPGND